MKLGFRKSFNDFDTLLQIRIASINSQQSQPCPQRKLRKRPTTTPRKAVSLAGKKQEKTCDMEAPSYRSLPAQEQRRHRMPSSVMPSFKIPPVDGETNIPKLRAAIRGLARCLGADLNSRFDPAYYIKVLEGAHGQLFVKLENILRNQKHQPTWASLIESLTHEPRPTSSSYLSRKAALELKPKKQTWSTRASTRICGSLDLRSLTDLWGCCPGGAEHLSARSPARSSRYTLCPGSHRSGYHGKPNPQGT